MLLPNSKLAIQIRRIEELKSSKNALLTEVSAINKELTVLTYMPPEIEIISSLEEFEEKSKHGVEIYPLDRWFKYRGHDEDGACSVVINGGEDGEGGMVVRLIAVNQVYNKDRISLDAIRAYYATINATHVVIETDPL